MKRTVLTLTAWTITILAYGFMALITIGVLLDAESLQALIPLFALVGAEIIVRVGASFQYDQHELARVGRAMVILGYGGMGLIALIVLVVWESFRALIPLIAFLGAILIIRLGSYFGRRSRKADALT